MHWETKKICVTCFIAIFALLQWSGTDPAISPSYACIWCCFSDSQDSQIQGWSGENGSGNTYFYPLAKFLLHVPTTLCSSGLNVLVPEGEMLPPGNTTMITLNCKLRLLPSHLGFFISLNQQVKKGVTVLAGAIDPDYQEEIGLLLHHNIILLLHPVCVCISCWFCFSGEP